MRSERRARAGRADDRRRRHKRTSSATSRDGPAADAEWDERLRGADGVLLLLDLPEAVMRRHPGLRVVSFCGTGARAFVDVDAARDTGITVCNVVNSGSDAAAEHAFALMLAAARPVPGGDRMIRAGGWGHVEGLQPRHKTLGVMGAGPIGTCVIEIGRALRPGLAGALYFPHDVSLEPRRLLDALRRRAARAGVAFVVARNGFAITTSGHASPACAPPTGMPSPPTR